MKNNVNPLITFILKKNIKIFLLTSIIIIFNAYQVAHSQSIFDKFLGSDKTLDKIKSDKIIPVGYIPWFYPFSYSNNTTPPSGFSVGFTKLLVNEINNILDLSYLQTKFVPMPLNNNFNNSYPALINKVVILECNTTLALAKKSQGVIFSKPFFVSTVHVLSPKNAKIQTIEDIRGKLLLTYEGFFQQHMLEVLNDEKGLEVGITSVPILQETGIKLEQKQGVGILGDALRIFNVLYALPDPENYVAGVSSLAEVNYVCSMLEGEDELKQIVDKAITAVLKKPDYQKLYNRWFILPAKDLDIALNYPMPKSLQKLITDAGGTIIPELVGEN